MKSLNCLYLVALICSSALVSGRSICKVIPKEPSNDKPEYKNFLDDIKNTSYDAYVKKLNEVYNKCKLEDFSKSGISKFCKKTYKLKDCQVLYNNVPSEDEFPESDKLTPLEARYYTALAKAACEKDENGKECPITDYLKQTGTDTEDIHLFDYIDKSCNSSKCFDNINELANARSLLLLHKNEDVNEKAYEAMIKEQKENNAHIGKCYDSNPSLINNYFSSDSEEERVKKLKDAYMRCSLGNFSEEGISNFCNYNYQLKKCQALIHHKVDEDDFSVSDRNTPLEAKYYIALAKAACEKDENGKECPITDYLKQTGTDTEDIHLSDYIAKSCNSSKCFDNMKEFASARSELYLYKNRHEENYESLEKEQKENEVLFEKCVSN